MRDNSNVHYVLNKIRFMAPTEKEIACVFLVLYICFDFVTCLYMTLVCKRILLEYTVIPNHEIPSIIKNYSNLTIFNHVKDAIFLQSREKYCKDKSNFQLRS